MSTSAELLGLLRDAKANPEDLTPRLILADWLEEHREPERAELVRLQCQDTVDQARVDAILSAHQVAWFGVLWAKRVQPLVQRGLFRVTGPASKLLSKRFAGQKNASELDWVEALSLEEIEDDQVPRLLHAPHAQCLNELRLWTMSRQTNQLPQADHDRTIGPWPLLEALPTLESLRTFALTGLPLGADGLRALLAGSPRNLRTLELDAANLGDGAMHHLAASPPLPHLERLDLSYNRIGDAGVAALASWPGLASVRQLDLGENQCGDEGFRALARSPHRAALRTLHLSTNVRADLSLLASGPPFPALEKLELRSIVGSRAMEALAATSLFPALRYLRIFMGQLGDEGVRHLLAAPWVASLNDLRLEYDRITDIGARLILESPRLGNLQLLDLNHNNDAITQPMMDALRDRFPTVWFF